MVDTVDSKSDERALSDEEKQRLQAVRDKGLELWALIGSFGASRELSLAQTAIEEAVIRTVEHVTGQAKPRTNT